MNNTMQNSYLTIGGFEGAKPIEQVLEKIRYIGPITAEMLPFCRLPDMVLSDMDLALDTATKMSKLLRC